jgi:hypothetical protein
LSQEAVNARARGSGPVYPFPAPYGSGLVNYGSGLRQKKKGGRVTIKTMAPVLEHNEMADDPYLMVRAPIMQPQ